MKSKYILPAIWFIDYAWVISLYLLLAFFAAVMIDVYFMAPYNDEREHQKTTWLIFIQVMIQLAIQGLIAITISIIVHKIPSPVQGLLKYDVHTSFGELLRNPAIVSVILFAMSETLVGRVKLLFARFRGTAKSLQNR